MRIELEFLDKTKCRVHEKEIVYEGCVPIPSVEEIVNVEGKIWRISRRDFIYLGRADSLQNIDVKVSFWCKKA